MSTNDNSDDDDLGGSPSDNGQGGEDKTPKETLPKSLSAAPRRPKKWEKGGPSPNVFGRPRKVMRMPTELQRYQDIIRSLSKPIDIRGEKIPFDILNLELIKKKALENHAPSQRFLDKLNREAREYVTRREVAIVARIDQLYQWLNNGDPPPLVKNELNRLGHQLRQLYIDMDADPASKRRAELRAAELKLKKLHEKWNRDPPPGWTPDNDDLDAAAGG